MKTGFAKTTNCKRFLAAIDALEQRGAPEASWLLVKGEPGFGKSRTLLWYAIQSEAIHIRAKAGYTPHWILTDLVTELGQKPERSVENLYGQVIAELSKRQQTLIFDEIEHALHDGRVLETIRDLSDMVECNVVIAGMDGVERTLARYPQITSRIAEAVTFEAVTLDDTKAFFGALCEVDVDDGAIELAHRQCDGKVRLLMNAIAAIERFGFKNGGQRVTMEVVRAADLVTPWTRPKSRSRRAA